MSRRKATFGIWLLVFLVLLSASAVLHPEQYAGKIYASSDARAVQAFKIVGDRMLAQGVYPLWNPYVFLGMPSYASLAYTPGVYPLERPVDELKHLFHLPPMTWLLLHLLILGLGTCGYLRWRGQSWMASVFAGAAVMAFPKLVAWCVYGHGTKVLSVAWLPWVLWMLEGVLRRGQAKWAVALAALLGVLLLRAHVQLTYYTAMAGFFWFCAFGIPLWKEEGGHRRLAIRSAWIFGACVLALLLATELYLPVLSYQAYSIRGAASTGAGVSFAYATSWSLGASGIPTLWWPTAVGYGKISYVGSMPFTDYPNYVGLPVLILAILALVLRRDRWTWMLAALAFFATLVAMGNHGFLYRLLYETLPAFKKFRVPVMILILQEFSLILLAAAGIDELTSHLKKENRPAWLTGAVALPLLGLALVLLILGTFGFDYLREQSINHWLSLRARVPVAALDAAAKLARADALRIGAIFLLSLAGALAFIRGRISRPVLAGLLGFLVFVDLYGVTRPIVHPERYLKDVDRNEQGRAVVVDAQSMIRKQSFVHSYVASNGALDFIKEQGSFPRVWPLGQYQMENLYAAQGIVSLAGYHAAKLRTYEEIRTHLYPPKGLPSLKLVDLLAADWVHVPNALPEPTVRGLAQQGLSLVQMYEGDGGVVYHNESAGPRAWIVDRFQLEQTGRNTSRAEPDTTVLDRVLAPNFDPATEVILSQVPSPAPEAGGSGEVRRLEENPQRIVFEAKCDRPSVAVFADVYYPDWEARIDGKPATVLRADYALRALALPSGDHRVEFFYRDGAFRTGRLLHRIALVILILAALALLVRALRSSSSRGPVNSAGEVKA